MITENHTECVEAVERAAKKLGPATEEHARLHTEHFEFPDSILPAAVALFEKLLFL